MLTAVSWSSTCVYHQNTAELGPAHSVSHSPEYHDLWYSKNVSRHLHASTSADTGGGVWQESHTTAAQGLLWLINT